MAPIPSANSCVWSVRREQMSVLVKLVTLCTRMDTGELGLKEKS